MFFSQQFLLNTFYSFSKPPERREENECIPYVSEYTDCDDSNRCSGCTKCTCSTQSQWICNKLYDCPKTFSKINEKSLNSAFNTLLSDINTNLYHSDPPNRVPTVEQPYFTKANSEDLVLENEDVENKIIAMLGREKRAIKSRKDGRRRASTDNNTAETEGNGTVKFYHVTNELNEDTLLSTNSSGIIQAAKVDMTHILAKQSNKANENNNTTSSALQIDYSSHHHNVGNKIDGNQSAHIIDFAEQTKIGIFSNHTQKEKDSDLSKIVVNELKKGKEFIGEKGAPVMSNITFIPENDTLTAMAFIAGNLLNKLWSMEKDSSDESMEIETMKNEKIQDLLDLFKEPLNIRQEAFIRNSLEILTKAMEQKDSSNLTLCEVIADAKKFINDSMKWEKSQLNLPEKQARKSQIPEPELKAKQQNSTLRAVEKLNNVLSLMKRYENVHKQLNDIKSGNKNLNVIKKTPQNRSSEFQRPVNGDDNESLNVFGNLLAKITKLLLPQKASKKFKNKIGNLNMFSEQNDKVNNKLKNIFKVDIGNLTLSSKDKAVLDYVMKVINNPKSLLEEITQKSKATNIEGDILLNLSEFFKIRSFVELMKLVDDKTEKSFTQSTIFLTTEVIEGTTEAIMRKFKDSIETDIKHIATEKVYTTTTTTISPKYETPKDKLKAHLKTILDDIVELQKESGNNKNVAPLKIADALPCIYNILKDDNEVPISSVSVKTLSPYEKFAKVLEEIKKEYNSSLSPTRRMNKDGISYRRNKPKSMQVWERVIENIHKQNALNKTTRRSFEFKIPADFEDILKQIRYLEEPSQNSYARLDLNDIPLADQKMLLKSIFAAAHKEVRLLKDIQLHFEDLSILPRQDQEDIQTFIENFYFNIKLDDKIIRNLEKSRNIKEHNANAIKESTFIAGSSLNYVSDKESSSSREKLIKQKENLKESLENYDKKMKLTRDEILNQLIKNRVTLYLKMKKETSEDDQFYSIAKNIMKTIESGNYSLARQLYKIFVSEKQRSSINSISDKSKDAMQPVRQISAMGKEGLIHFEEPKIASNPLLTSQRDQMLKNLLNPKNFRLM